MGHPRSGWIRKILTYLDCTAGLRLGSYSLLKKITSEQVEEWAFGNFFNLFGLREIIVVDADGLFPGMFKDTFQDTLLIPSYAVTRGNHKAIIN